MTRTTRSRRRLSGRASVGALLALAVVATAGAPSVITIRPGDTLWGLARAHATTVAALRELNDLPGNGTIYVGDTLRVGGDGGGPAGTSTYRVQAGDTLSEIAQRFGTTTAALRRANRLPGSTVVLGRRLVIPGGGGASIPSTNAGKRVPERVRRSVAEHRRVLAQRSLPSKAQVRAMVAATARRNGVPPSLAVAVAYHESGFQQRVVSGVDAIGVMQVLPSTGRALSRRTGRTLDLLDTEDNITAGVLLLRQLLRSSPSTDRALAGYYQGAGSIARQGILPQTRDYIRSISVLQRRFADG